MAFHFFAAWLIACLESLEAAEGAVRYVTPVCYKDEYVSRALRNIVAYLPKSIELKLLGVTAGDYRYRPFNIPAVALEAGAN